MAVDERQVKGGKCRQGWEVISHDGMARAAGAHLSLAKVMWLSACSLNFQCTEDNDSCPQPLHSTTDVPSGKCPVSVFLPSELKDGWNIVLLHKVCQLSNCWTFDVSCSLFMFSLSTVFAAGLVLLLTVVSLQSFLLTTAPLQMEKCALLLLNQAD